MHLIMDDLPVVLEVPFLSIESSLSELNNAATSPSTKLGHLRHILERRQLDEVSLNALSIAYADHSEKMRASVLATVCAAGERWGLSQDECCKAHLQKLISRIRQETNAELLPWCLVARTVLGDSSATDLAREIREQWGSSGTFSLSLPPFETRSDVDILQQKWIKAVLAAAGRILNGGRMAAFYY
jgi:hypothetical protein